MNRQSYWFSLYLITGFWVVVASSDQDGFLSLCCGGTTNYTDKYGISWIQDSEYIHKGNTTTIFYRGGNSSSTVPARYFSDSQGRTCYRLSSNDASPSLVLVRAEFLYKNYDGLRKPPVFSVSLGTAVVSTVDLAKQDPFVEEFVWKVGRESVPLCLLGVRRKGFPVISSLEVRPLPEGAYESGMEDFPNKSLRKSHRINCGYTQGSLRYPSDPFDRIWDLDTNFSPFHSSTGFKLKLGSKTSGSIKEIPPAVILQTARVLVKREVLTYNLPLDNLGDYYIILYFEGILPIEPSFDVMINGHTMHSNFTVKISETSALYLTAKRIRSLNITLKSTRFNPQINAIEVYEMVDTPPETSSTTVSALEVIQQSTGLDFGWQDDPCSPTLWDHIGCEGSHVTSLKLGNINLRSICPTFGDLLDLKELDLHNTSLSGEIQNLGSLQRLETLNLSFNHLTSFGSDLENLASLKVLDLQNNSLQETVPESLGELEDLHLLNLESNKLQGALPQSLNKDSLEIRTSGNLCLSFSTMSCNDVSSNPSSIETPQVTIFSKKPHDVSSEFDHLAIIIGATCGTMLVLLTIALSAFFYIRKKRRSLNKYAYNERVSADIRNWNAEKVFTYKEIKAATHNFKEVIGRGSFGLVYFGKLKDGKLVAVKVRFDKTKLGADSFVNEVCLLSRIRHQNLVSLEGFCHETKQQILVYEYLPGGSLSDHLYGPNGRKVPLSWIRRLKIAVDAAKGLDYLHNGTEPRIIHRDVKSSNILLDVEMNAKVCDFGLSKQVMQADASHVTTVVKGTAGYLDPEYYSTQQLTEKSDVYSFGVVLLELICGREPLTHSGNPDTFNLVLWAKPYLQAGAFEIVDDSLKGSFEAESMRKTAHVAVRSVDRDASQRPTIANVLAQLKEAYSIQLSYLASQDM